MSTASLGIAASKVGAATAAFTVGPVPALSAAGSVAGDTTLLLAQFASALKGVAT